MKNKTKTIKQKWAYDITTSPFCDESEELKIWFRKSEDLDDEENPRAQINKLDTVLTCICGNHPWTNKIVGRSRRTAITVAGPPRTGSTLVLIAIEEILHSANDNEYSLYKTHELFDSRCPFIFDQFFRQLVSYVS